MKRHQTVTVDVKFDVAASILAFAKVVGAITGLVIAISHFL